MRGAVGVQNSVPLEFSSRLPFTDEVLPFHGLKSARGAENLIPVEHHVQRPDGNGE